MNIAENIVKMEMFSVIKVVRKAAKYRKLK